MPPPGSPPRPRPHARRALALVAGLSLLFGAVGAWRDADREEGLLWDLSYYKTAADRWNRGLDPYLDDGAPTGYYYSLAVTPLVARAFTSMEAKAPLATLLGLAVVAAIALAVAAARPPPTTVALAWLFALAFGNAESVYVLAAGNLAAVVGLALAAALFAASRGRWPLFYLLLGLAALVKPYALVLLLLPLLLGRLSLWAPLAIAPWAADFAYAWLARPELAASRVEAIRLGVIEPLQLRYSLAGRLSRLLADLPALDASQATAIAVAVQLAVAAALALQVHRRRSTLEPHRAFALATVAAFSALPRMAGYDAFVFGPAVFVAFWPPPLPEEGLGHATAGWLALALGLLKEGLAVLPIAALVALGRRPGGR